jgi:phosphoesterase RecJ-like protein
MNNTTNFRPMSETIKEQLEPIVAQLQDSRSILISAHKTPHGGALCGMLALGLALKSFQKHVCMHCKDAIPSRFSFLPSVDDVDRSLNPEGGFDTAVVLKYTNYDSAEIADVLQKDKPTVISIDPHHACTGCGDFQIIDPAASGTTEMVYRIVKQLPAVIDRQIATAIYTGIQSDTDYFRHQKTNRASFGIAAEMLNHGVHPAQVARQLTGVYSIDKIRLLNRAIDSLEVTNNGKVSVMTITRDVLQDIEKRPEDLDEIIDCAYRIKGVKLAILIKEMALEWTHALKRRSCFHVSLRTGGDVNAGQIAEEFGGSGHASAASFFISATLSELKARMFNLLETMTDKRLGEQADFHNNLFEKLPKPARRFSSVG